MSRHVRVIVVAYNSAALIPECLDSIAAQEGVEVDVVVVDNASTDGSADVVRARGHGVRLIETPENLGFGRANNLALVGDAPFFGLVNPDATLPPRALAACLAVLDTRPSVGIVGLRHQDAAGNEQPSAFPFLTLAGLWRESVGAHRILPMTLDPSRAGDVDWIQGSFMVIRGEVVRQVGGFDPAYFMYGEDMEWCWRIRAAGWAIAYLPDPVVRHIGGASAGPSAPALFVEHLKSRVRFFRAHRGRLAAAGARMLIAGAVLARWALRELVPGDGGKRALFRAAARWVLAGQPLDDGARP